MMTKQHFNGSSVAKNGWQTLQALNEDQKASIDQVALKKHFTWGAIEATMETAEIFSVKQTTQEHLMKGMLREEEEVVAEVDLEAFVSRAREIFDAIYSRNYSVDWKECDSICEAFEREAEEGENFMEESSEGEDRVKGAAKSEESMSEAAEGEDSTKEVSKDEDCMREAAENEDFAKEAGEGEDSMKEATEGGDSKKEAMKCKDSVEV